MAKLTPEQFVSILTDYELLDPDRLTEVAERLQPVYRDSAYLAAELEARGWLTRYQTEQILAGKGDELKLGAFRLLAPLGEGGMGQVFKAEQRRLGRIVALKVIHQEYLANRPEAVKRFHREARAAAQLAHPNAIRIYDADQDGPRHFIVMEHVEGLDLTKLVDHGGPLPIAVACDYIAQAALGLEHAHELGLIHRDIKPSNLLVSRAVNSDAKRRTGFFKPIDPNMLPSQSGKLASRGTDPASLLRELRAAGVVKIVDMGLARVIDQIGSESALTVEGNVMGTPDYIAPEQARNPHGVDARADLYSLGCTFYYALAGRPPFPKSSALEKLMMHQFDEPLAVEVFRSHVPEAVGAIVRKMIAKNPDDRFQSALEVHLALIELAPELMHLVDDIPRLGADVQDVSSTDICAIAPSPHPITPFAAAAEHTPIGEPKLRERTLSDLGPPSESLAKMGKSTGELNLALSKGEFKSLAEPGSEAPTHPQPEPPPKQDDHFSMELDWSSEPKGAGSTVDGPLEGSATLHTLAAMPPLPPPREPEPSIDWAKPIAETGRPPEARTVGVLHGHKGCVVALAFAPSRTVIATGGVDGTVRIWGLHAGEFRPQALHEARGGEVHSLAFAPDERVLAYATVDGRIWLLNLDEESPNPSDVRELLPPGRESWEVAQRLGAAAKRQGPLSSVLPIDFSVNGRLLAVGAGKSLHLFDLATHGGKHWVELSGHVGDILDVRVSPDGKLIATASKDETLRFWNPAKFFGKLHMAMKVPGLTCIAYSPDGQQLAFGSRNHTFQIWGIASKEPQRLAKFEHGHGSLRLLQFLESGAHICAVDDQGLVGVRDLATGLVQEQWSVPFVKAYSYALSSNGRYLATGNIDGTVLIHRVAAKSDRPSNATPIKLPR